MLNAPSISTILPEVTFTATTGGGPGGQHVNKVSTKVTLRWSINLSTALCEEQRELLLRKLGTKLTKEGELLISSHESRSQSENKELVVKRLEKLLMWAFTRTKPRKATKPSKAAVQKRIDSKKRLGEKKKLRGKEF